MKGVVNSAPFFYIARNPDHECLWGHTSTSEDIFRESGSGCVHGFYVHGSPIFDFIWINVIRLGMCYN